MLFIRNSVIVLVFSIILASGFASSASAWHLFPFFGQKDHKVTLSNDLPSGSTTTVIWYSTAQKENGGICYLQRIKAGEKAVYEYSDEQRKGKMIIIAVVDIPMLQDKVQVVTHVIKGKHRTIPLSRIIPSAFGEYGDKAKVFAQLQQFMAQ